MTEFGNYLIPCVIGLILVFGLVRRVPLFDTFLEGAKEGAKSPPSVLSSLGRADYSGKYAEGQRRFGYVYRVHRAAGGKDGRLKWYR